MSQVEVIPMRGSFVAPETKAQIQKDCAELLDICRRLDERPKKTIKKKKAA